MSACVHVCMSLCLHVHMCVCRHLCLLLWTRACACGKQGYQVQAHSGTKTMPSPPTIPSPARLHCVLPKGFIKTQNRNRDTQSTKRMQGRCLRLPVPPRSRHPHPSSSCPLCPTHIPSICLPQAWHIWTPSHTTAVPGIPAGQQQAWACSNTTRMKRRPLGGSWGAQPAGTWHHWPPLTPTPANTTRQTPQLQPSLPPLGPPCPDKLFKSSIRKCKKCTRTQTPSPAAPSGAAAGKAHLKRERDSAAVPAAAAWLPRRQRWHDFPADLWQQRLVARDRGLSPRAAVRREEGCP